MSGGTQSPPLENTAPVDPLGNASVSGDKGGHGLKDAEQRKEEFNKGDGKGTLGSGAGNDISKAASAADDSAKKFEAGRKDA